MKTFGFILLGFWTLLCGAYRELNHNTIFGWGLSLIWMGIGVLVWNRLPLPGPVRGICYCAGLVVIAALSGPPVKAVPAVSYNSPKPTGTVTTAYGQVSGVFTEDGKAEVYAGIPYAAPPIGELRWKAPQDPQPWDGVRVCDTFAPMSMQVTNPQVISSLSQIIGYHDYKISLKDNWVAPVSEDSLYLNIWKPAGEQKNLPVAVYIHGGSLQTGQPWYADYSGEGYARDGVICVNMGYRLGVFGFYADEEALQEDGTTGNYGLLDQIKALEWVRDNIAAFGGDPGNVTIIGESAGSACVDALCVSPLAKGLFRRAILESSTLSSVQPPHSYRSLEDALASGRKLKEKYGVKTLAELKALPADKIVGEMSSQHHITPDGYVLPDDPYVLRRQGVHNEEALLHGFNSEESAPFIIFSHASMKDYEEKVRGYFKEYADDVLKLYPAVNDSEADKNWADIYGAVFFNYSHECLNRLAVQHGIPAYEYLFAKKNGRLGPWHSGEMVYTFGVIPADSRLYDESDRQLSALMHAYWVNFVRTGNPNGDGLPEFPEASENTLIVFDDPVSVQSDPQKDLYEILDRMQGFGQ